MAKFFFSPLAFPLLAKAGMSPRLDDLPPASEPYAVSLKGGFSLLPSGMSQLRNRAESDACLHLALLPTALEKPGGKDTWSSLDLG